MEFNTYNLVPDFPVHRKDMRLVQQGNTTCLKNDAPCFPARACVNAAGLRKNCGKETAWAEQILPRGYFFFTPISEPRFSREAFVKSSSGKPGLKRHVS